METPAQVRVTNEGVLARKKDSGTIELLATPATQQVV